MQANTKTKKTFPINTALLFLVFLAVAFSLLYSANVLDGLAFRSAAARVAAPDDDKALVLELPTALLERLVDLRREFLAVEAGTVSPYPEFAEPYLFLE